MRPYVPRLVVTEDCHGCGVCLPVCEPKAISMRARHNGDDARGPVAHIDASLCNMCRECLDVCPVEAIREPYPPPWREAKKRDSPSLF